MNSSCLGPHVSLQHTRKRGQLPSSQALAELRLHAPLVDAAGERKRNHVAELLLRHLAARKAHDGEVLRAGGVRRGGRKAHGGASVTPEPGFGQGGPWAAAQVLAAHLWQRALIVKRKQSREDLLLGQVSRGANDLRVAA